MPAKSTTSKSSLKLSWRCVSTRPGREEAVANEISSSIGLEAWTPRVADSNEALFPGCVFARCDLSAHADKMLGLSGVIDFVRYGRYCPEAPKSFVKALREAMEKGRAEQAGAYFAEFEAMADGSMQANERLAMLMDYMGMQASEEAPILVAASR